MKKYLFNENRNWSTNLLKLAFVWIFFFFAACEDESPLQVKNASMAVVNSTEDLAECEDANDGEMAWVKGEHSARICVDGEWQSAAEPHYDTVTVAGDTVYKVGENIECAIENFKNNAGVKIVCNGDSIGVVYNGRDGEDGADGNDGKNGSDGAAGPRGESGDKGDAGSAGAAGSDGENGNDGTNGSDGEDGEACKLIDDKAGRVVVVCGKDSVTLYKALCGEKPYNPESHFCAGELVYERCGGAAYDVESYFCIDDSLSLKCEKKSWDPKNYMCDARDGRLYKVVFPGMNLMWMAENLKFDYKVNGSVYGTFCYNNDCKSDSSKIFGRYYTWAAAMDSSGLYSENGAGCGFGKVCTPKLLVRGICPEGWHLPMRSEWDLLYSSVPDSVYSLQAKGIAAWPKATDTYGFSALPAGVHVGDFVGKPTSGSIQAPDYIDSAGFAYVGREARIWTSDDRDKNRAYYWYIGPGMANYTSPYYFGKDSGLSVRCVKD